jgi:mono/diheme cytochrome c family protein
MSYLVASVGSVGFFAMSVLLLGVWPGRVLDRQIRATAPPQPLPLSPSETRGRSIYGSEGCAYCHTQQIRYLSSDVSRFGAATLAWETEFDYPQLWGTRRIGPDLSREWQARSPDWQLAHLYAPRHLVADSVMPAYPWLFDGAPDRPRQPALDLLAYLETLGRARALAGAEGDAHARAALGIDARLAFGAPELSANPATARRSRQHPELSAPLHPERGPGLYRDRCASCHGPAGHGDGPGAAGLHPRPANLAEHQYTLDALGAVLWNGVAGTAMPAWRDLAPDDLAALAAAVRSLSAAQPEVPPLDSGRRVYAAHCAQCHGDRGAGDGSAAGQFPIAPTNFTAERPSYDTALRAVRDGVADTPMAAWSSRLSGAELSAVAGFVRGFFQP